MRTRILVAATTVLLLLAGAEGCPAKSEPAPAPAPAPAADTAAPLTLRVRVWAEPKDGDLILALSGFALTPKGAPLQMGDSFPYLGRVRNPTITNLRYPPTVKLQVTVVVTAPPGQRTIGCEIIDKGRAVSYKMVEKAEDIAGTVQCGPYNTATGLVRS